LKFNRPNPQSGPLAALPDGAVIERKTPGDLVGCIAQDASDLNRNDTNTEEEIREVSLYDGKESGSLENSCGVLLGMWKTSTTDMKCRVLKNTKGLAGNTATMKIRDGTFIIEPRND
jgi:hypothetical protein